MQQKRAAHQGCNEFTESIKRLTRNDSGLRQTWTESEIFLPTFYGRPLFFNA